eukprot:2144256-Amphidinium_carterae.1
MRAQRKGRGKASSSTSPKGSNAPGNHTELTASQLAANPPELQRKMLGEYIYPLVLRMLDNKEVGTGQLTDTSMQVASKVTGMLLEMDNSELLASLASQPLLKSQVNDAVGLLSEAAVRDEPAEAGWKQIMGMPLPSAVHHHGP